MAKSVPLTVPMRYVTSMVGAAVAQGASQDTVLSWTSGISAAMLDAPRARVSLAQFSRLYGAVARYLADEGAGLSGCKLPLGSVETMTRAGITASTLAECTDVIAKAMNAMLHDLDVTATNTDEAISISLSEARAIEWDRNNTYELILLTCYSTLSWLFGQRLPLLRVDFPCAAPRHQFELRTLFGGRIHFNQKEAALHFSPGSRELPIMQTPSEIPKFVRRSPGNLIEALLFRGKLTTAVRAEILRALPVLPRASDVASRLAVSPRSLHRKLEAEGESFQKIKDELRRDVAIYALTRTTTPLKQIAIDVGYADQASFQRAFVQWTGRSPGAWRRASDVAG